MIFVQQLVVVMVILNLPPSIASVVHLNLDPGRLLREEQSKEQEDMKPHKAWTF